MGTVYRLTLRQLSGRWRLVIMSVLAALPVIVAVLVLRSDSTPSVAEFEVVVLSTMLAGSIAPLVVLAIGGAAFANEVEDRIADERRRQDPPPPVPVGLVQALPGVEGPGRGVGLGEQCGGDLRHAGPSW